MREMSRFDPGLFSDADDVQPHGAFDRGPERRRPHRHGLDPRGILLQLDFDEGRGGRDEVFGRQQALVAHRRRGEAADAGRHALDDETSGRIRRGALPFVARHHDGGVGHGLPRQAVDDPPRDGIGLPLLRPDRHAARRKQQERKYAVHDSHAAKIRKVRENRRRRLPAGGKRQNPYPSRRAAAGTPGRAATTSLRAAPADGPRPGRRRPSRSGAARARRSLRSAPRCATATGSRCTVPARPKGRSPRRSG